MKPLTFKEAYANAVKISDKLDLDEPAKTEKALKLLTEIETFQVPSYKNLFPPEAAGILIKFGLKDRMWRLSREMAQMDEDFKAVAEKLWEPKSGIESIVLMMEKWGQINNGIRLYVADAIKNDKKPLDSRSRDAILALGGKKWIEDH